jgi:hypothetical protein
MIISVSVYYYLAQDVYFDDESAEVVISSLRLGDEQDRFILFYCALTTFIPLQAHLMFATRID